MVVVVTISAPSSAVKGANFNVSGIVFDEEFPVQYTWVYIYYNGIQIGSDTTDVDGAYLDTVHIDVAGDHKLKAICLSTSSPLRDITIIEEPTVTTQAATDKSWLNGTYEATLHGTITDTGGENCSYRGFQWGSSPGNYPFSLSESDGFGTGTFQRTSSFSGTVYFRAYARNSAGYGYGSERTLTEPPPPPPPDPPTNVAATDGSYNTYVRVTWTKSPGATDYQVYRDGTPLGWIGDVDVHKDYGADAGSITGGSSVASDGIYVEHVALGVTGEGTSSGDTHVYKVKAKNDAGESGYSATNNGYRGVGSLSYQWYRSAGDSDGSYSILPGGSIQNYNDTTAPENGDGRYYKCYLSASGASSKYSSPDRGYRAVAVEAVTMIGGPSGFTWGTPVPGTSVVRITTDGGMTWAWGVASGTIMIPDGSWDNWIWKEFTL